jgi:hypothetical protein
MLEICEAYWLCVEGELVNDNYFMCPVGLLFDPVLQKCNVPSAVECNSL